MKNPFRKKSTLEKLAAPVEKTPRVVKSGLVAVGTFVGVTLASGFVSKARGRQDPKS
jgi:hypothetical protein